MNYQSLIPDNWHGIRVQNEDDLIYLGSYNLREMRVHWERKARRYGVEMGMISDHSGNDYDLLSAKKAIAESRMFQLGELAEKADDKPCIACYRPDDYFKVDSAVMCFVDRPGGKYQNTFLFGRVVKGYRCYDGCVTVLFDEVVDPGLEYDEHILGYYTSRPEVIRTWEYEYFKNDLDYFSKWLEYVGAGHWFNSQKMYKALVES